jgi:hypothetical protein
MRTGEWLWLPVALAFSGCQGDYPLEPTPCDRYCHATHGLNCYSYEPADCVLECERNDIDNAACLPALEATSACFDSTPDALAAVCRFLAYGSPGGSPPLPCDAQSLAYSACMSGVKGDGTSYP